MLKDPLKLSAVQGNPGLAQKKLMEAGALIGDALHGAVRGGPGEVVFVLQQQDNTNIDTKKAESRQEAMKQ